MRPWLLIRERPGTKRILSWMRSSAGLPLRKLQKEADLARHQHYQQILRRRQERADEIHAQQTRKERKLEAIARETAAGHRRAARRSLPSTVLPRAAAALHAARTAESRRARKGLQELLQLPRGRRLRRGVECRPVGQEATCEQATSIAASARHQGGMRGWLLRAWRWTAMRPCAGTARRERERK